MSKTTRIRHQFVRACRMLLASFMTSLVCVTLNFPAWSATSTSITSGPDTEALEVIINIRSREFRPNTLAITVGQKTRLVLKNLDTELHAFVPVGLLADSHVTVSGNGAPQFAKEGFVRVLLPTRGQTEIVFTPARPGTYPYFCDLPGHVMRGTIVVRENPGMVN